MRFVVLAVLVLGLAGCATPAGSRTVDIEGRIVEIAAAAGGRDFVLDVTDQGMLPLELPDNRPPLNARGVVIEVPDGLNVPDDAEGRFDALAEWVAESGENLVVVDYLT